MLTCLLQAQILARTGGALPPRPATSTLQGHCAAVVNPQATAVGPGEPARSPCVDRATAQPALKGFLLPDTTVDALVSAKAHEKGAPNAGQKSSGDAAPAPGTPRPATPMKRPVSADLPSEPAGPIPQRASLAA